MAPTPESPAPTARRIGRPPGSKTRLDPATGLPPERRKRLFYTNANRANPSDETQESLRSQVAMMTAARLSPTAIARGLKTSKARVDRILGEVHTGTLVEDFRKLVRAHALSQSLDIAVKGMAWVNEVIDARDPKAFDLVSRGMASMEKTWASASGENRPQGVQVAVINQPGETSAEIARLVEMLVGPTP